SGHMQSRNRLSSAGCSVQGARCSVQGARCCVTHVVSLDRAQGIAPCTLHSAPGTWHRAPSTGTSTTLFLKRLFFLKRLSDAEVDAPAACLRLTVDQQARNRIQLISPVETDRSDGR